MNQMKIEDKYLPLGTIIKIKDNDQKYMIIGFCMIKPGQKEIYDYSVCLYPYGIIDTKATLLINQNQIIEIISSGYITDEYKSFNERLKEIINNK